MQPTSKLFLDYEIRSSLWVSFLSNSTLQTWAAKYFARKVRRKYKRYANSLKMQQMVEKEFQAQSASNE